MLLNRDDWYDCARDLEWTLSYVDHEVAFPQDRIGAPNVPAAAWQAWDEPFRVSYRDYVRIQREKETGVKAVSDALGRSGTYEKLDPSHIAASQFHMGTLTIGEHSGITLQSHYCRFAPSPRWRSLAVFGMLDEVRHTQLDLRFSHALLRHDPRFDWAQKSFHTEHWVLLAVKSFIDGTLHADCVEAALTSSLTFEHGFTNLQFVALAADAMAAGDVNWSNLLSSIQTDEARHAQIGFPTLGIVAEHDPEQAQRIVDIAFWRATRLFQNLTGTAMDYYTPVDQRKLSFKEFMLEWVVNHHARILEDYGLKKPWYWDEFLYSLDHGHHAAHLGQWFYRPTLFWRPNAGVSADERAWLREKYPSWEENWGVLWDQITENVRAGRMEATLPATLPALCSVTQLAVGTAMAPRDVAQHQTVYKDHLYTFDSAISQWCFEQDPERYVGFPTLVDRMLGGQIQPPDLKGTLDYMGMTPDVEGTDAHDYAWAGEGA
jgi:hypothetical protein